MSIELYFDGASKSNPGPAGCGYYIKYADNTKTSYGGYKFLGNATNNEAEYSGLINGLATLVSTDPDTLIVHGDSKLVIEQMKGTWKVRAQNLVPYWTEAQTLSKKFKKIEFKHIDRSLNSKADQLANLSIKTLSESTNYQL
jgi:ribonuclease HI